MATYVLEDFRRGVDTRRAAFARPAGSLAKGLNVHITSGGDIETRKAFIEIATLPEGCFGLEGLQDTIYTFGTVTPPVMPSGFTYQQFTHPDGLAMTEVLDVEPYDGEAFVIAKFGDDVRTYFDGVRVQDLDTDVSRFRFSVTGGSADVANKITSITVNAVEILTTEVLWATSNAATAALIAAQVNATTSDPNYTAYVPTGTAEVVITSPNGTISTGQAVVLTVAGNLTTSLTGGTMEAPISPPTSARTVGEKMYVTSGSNLLFSAVGDCTNLSVNSDGGGFINMATHSSGAEDLVGTELFYEDLVVCAKKTLQRWHVEADDSQNRRLQTFRNTGLLGSRGVTSYMDGPTFLISTQGVRVVQTRDSEGRSLTRPDSKAVDRELVAYIKSLTAAERARAILLVEPEDDRLWAVIGARIYVRSWFSGWDGPAWTEYAPGFTILDYAISDQRLYLLADTGKVYLYGGTTGSEYDGSEAIVRLAYANARAPANLKGLMGLDLGIEGEWRLDMSLDAADEDFNETAPVGTFSDATFDSPTIPLAGQATHVSLELRNTTAEFARISSITFHYKTDDAG